MERTEMGKLRSLGELPEAVEPDSKEDIMWPFYRGSSYVGDYSHLGIQIHRYFEIVSNESGKYDLENMIW